MNHSSRLPTQEMNQETKVTFQFVWLSNSDKFTVIRLAVMWTDGKCIKFHKEPALGGLEVLHG